MVHARRMRMAGALVSGAHVACGLGTRAPGSPPKPPWWPDFERELREYAERRSRAAR